MVRQTDDFAGASLHKETLIDLYQDIDKDLKMVVENTPMPLMYGVSIIQTQEYNKLNMEQYLNLLIKKYTWLQGIESVPIEQAIPIPPKYFEELDTAELPKTSAQCKAIEEQEGVNYHSLYGQVLFPMVCCRPDICAPISKLGQVLVSPAAIHYRALKAVAVYLIQTKTDGPIYWRRRKRMDLPQVPFNIRPVSPEHHINSPWDPIGPTALVITEEMMAQSDKRYNESYPEHQRYKKRPTASSGRARCRDGCELGRRSAKSTIDVALRTHAIWYAH
jgi:hypothetical protein